MNVFGIILHGVKMQNKYDCLETDLFNEKSKEITLADYIKKVTQWPCVVVGGEPPEEKEKEDGIY